VQDLDPAVQKAVNRLQPAALTQAVLEKGRALGVSSINLDLIYGLPKQTMATMAQTLSQVIDANPDRIAVYHYAHLPHLFKPQRRINEKDLPSSDTKLDMLALCIKKLNQAGYVYIGMDHFAKPDDELAVAQRQGRLHRNFQGYSTHAEADLVACGVSAISSVGLSYSQNVKTLDEYYAALDKDQLPITRGYKLTMDDLSGGTYTFTNNGSFGILAATPVILQPQVGIFCVGTIAKRPIVTEDDAIAIRQMMYATHTYDHRVIDGEVGSKFLRHVINTLQNMDPAALF
jgi:oxygen-independent coproporphyrinogen III oxidase